MENIAIQPEDLTEQEKQQILAFFNSVSSAEGIARGIELAGELDVGVGVGARILSRRDALGGVFDTVQQIADVPYVGPERFSEIVIALTGRLAPQSELDIVKAELQQLKRTIAQLAKVKGKDFQINVEALAQPVFVGQPLPLLLSVKDAQGKPVEANLTIKTNRGIIHRYQDLALQRGSVINLATDIRGEAKVILVSEHSQRLSVLQQSALENALHNMNSSASIPEQDGAGFQHLVNHYLNPRNGDLRAAIDCYFAEQRQAISSPYYAENFMTRWRHRAYCVEIFMRASAAEQTVVSQGVYHFNLREWIWPWFQSLQHTISQQSQLSEEISIAKDMSDDSVRMADNVISRVQAFVSASRGLAGESATQRIADKAIQQFLAQDLADISPHTKAALYPALSIAAESVRANGQGTLSAVTQTRTDLSREIKNKQIDTTGLDNISARLDELTPQLNSFHQRYGEFEQSMSGFSLNYENFVQEYQNFNSQYQTFNADYLSFQSNINLFNTDLLDFNNNYQVFASNFDVFSDQYEAFNLANLNFDIRMQNFNDKYQKFVSDNDQFKSSMLTFNSRYEEFSTKVVEFNGRYNSVTTSMSLVNERISGATSDLDRFDQNVTKFNQDYDRFKNTVAENPNLLRNRNFPRE